MPLESSPKLLFLLWHTYTVAHLDDLYLQDQSYEQCVHNVIDSTVLFDQLGLVLYTVKYNIIDLAKPKSGAPV